VLDATRAAVADDPQWDWCQEELTILRMGCDFIVKKPELATLLPDKWREPFTAALVHGHRPDIGYNRSGFYFRAWKTKAGEGTAAPAADAQASDTPAGWSLYDSARVEPPRWLIKGLLPETGMAIIPGQWGSYKTTTALDMALAVMTNRPFAGQYRIKRAGAVIYFALEGAGTLQSRLAAIARQPSAPDRLPFAWRGDCPLLTAKDAGPAIAVHCDAAARYFKRAYGVPTVLILIDTYSVAAGFTLSGDDSDVSATQKTFNALRYVHKHTGAAVVVVDHFGKMMESGTRGSSNKEGNADAVLATLADKEINGTISNTRLAVRKQRDGRSGFEIPFTPQVVELGLDEDGDPITAVVLDWGNPRMTAHPVRKSKDLTCCAPCWQG
jgi:AAA domain